LVPGTGNTRDKKNDHVSQEKFTGKENIMHANLMCILSFCAVVICQAQIYYPDNMPEPVLEHNVLRITSGGIYTGNWTSLDPDVPAVEVITSETVIIENAIIASRGICIQAYTDHADVTVRHCYGFGLNPEEEGRMQGRFLRSSRFDNMRVENCFIEQTTGIWVGQYIGNGSDEQTIKILRNQARNNNGRYSNGNGGYSNTIVGQNYSDMRQFCQFGTVRDIANAEIAWNECINEPFISRTEDVINMYESRGTSESPIAIHDNFFDGSYSEFPDQDIFYTGGGIMAGDGDGCGYIHAFNNQVIRTQNYGVAILDGYYSSRLYGNTVVNSYTLPDGRKYHGGLSGGNGVQLWGWRGVAPVDPYCYDNDVGVQRPDGSRSDYWMPDCPNGNCYDNRSIDGPITRETEDAQYPIWFAKLQAAGVNIGPQDATPVILTQDRKADALSQPQKGILLLPGFSTSATEWINWDAFNLYSVSGREITGSNKSLQSGISILHHPE
jgi:hypothetical protein